MHETISSFLETKKSGNDNTYANTKTAVGHFTRWLGETDPREIDALDIEEFCRWLKNKNGLAEITCIRYVRSISSYYEYIQKRQNGPRKRGEIDRRKIVYDNPVHEADIAGQFDASRDTKRSKELRKDYFALSLGEMKLMVENVPDPVFRNQLLFKVMGQTGCRPGEITDIRLQDVTQPELWDNNRIRIRASKTQNNRTVRYSDSLKFYLTQWIEQGERDRFYKAGESDYLFPTHKSDSISSRRIQEITRQTAENAGIQERIYTDSKGHPRYKVTAYAFRHGFAENMVLQGCDLARLKKLMGHTDISMTQKYLDPNDEALDETIPFIPEV
ncbi:tyrosine-type recombinase/integrase [Natronosalvus rutilus]|uniref:Tyrosine-type recombinase/integrase n=1 Tax=Natronosalvus rutilus TaxID=2953753 RepID=A0A9E7N804_9EURY|nr:site-specific integrase [Natronosalvus rutilus]UTF53414.1 tyrosine-type recombinase/integrase [Natronosalvus rutilus]